MPNTLIIRINNQESACFECWLPEHEVLKIKAGSLSAGERDSLQNFLINTNKIIVLVPGEEVLLTQIVMPHLSAGRLLKALKFALEDQLTEDPSLLHFSIGRRLANGEITVAVVSKEKINAWQEELRLLLGEDFSKVTSFIPDMLALPHQAETISILIDQNLVRMKLSDDMGYVFEKNELSIFLELILSKQTITKSSIINFYQHDQETLLSDQDLQRLGVTSHTHPLPSHALNLMAPVALSLSGINLLQRDYALRRDIVSAEKAIYLSATLIGIWLTILTLTNFIENYLLYREGHTLHTNLETIYHSIYPNAALPTHPKNILQNELAHLRANTQDSAFIRLLSSVSIVVLPMTSQGVIPEKVTYRDNRLSLELVADDAMVLNQLKQALEQIGLRVVMGGAERSTSGSIKTRFTIEEMS